MNKDDKPIALVTGCNRGLGWHTAQQLGQQGYRVICACRRQAEETARQLQQEGIDAVPFPLDVTEPEQSRRLADWIRTEFGRLDVLVNNAGVFLDSDVTLFELDDERLHTSLNINLLGPTYLCRALLPLMIEQGSGRVVNVTSGYGSLTGMGPKITAYRISKAGLNALTKVMAAEVDGHDIKVNAVCPGWVSTDMGGPDAPGIPAEAAADIVWAATLPPDGPNGELLRHRKPIAG